MGYDITYKTQIEFYECLNKINPKAFHYNIAKKTLELENLTEVTVEDHTYRDTMALFHECLGVDIDIHKKTMADFMSYKKRYLQKNKPKVA